ncbi:MAG TPA: hypothetical protein VG711_04040, partial [Phycisphaerales bacterium]|nr:hypothetical protein [Phycisphaerales bacterium]
TRSYQQIAQRYNDRIARLPQLSAQGVIELKWSDKHGSHSDQGDLQLYFQRPSSTAIRVSAVGEVLMWVGSDNSAYWVFDLHSKPKTLTLGSFTNLSDNPDLAIHPAAFLDLMGWSPLPLPPQSSAAPSPTDNSQETAPASSIADNSHEPSSTAPDFSTSNSSEASSQSQSFPDPVIDPQTHRIIITTQGAGGPMRLFLDPDSLLPLRIESLAPSTRALIAYSELSRYQSVITQGVSVLEYPRIAQLVDIHQADDAGYVKIALGSQTDGRTPDGSLDPVFSRIFDLDRLRKAMPVDEVIDQSSK